MKLTRWFFLVMLMSGSVVAQDIKLVGSIKQVLKRPNLTMQRSNARPVMTSIALLKLKLSPLAERTIHHRVNTVLQSASAPLISMTGLPRQVQRGMANVPVLNQGGYGTCVTFATTAAIDAAFNKGDYLSQLCALQLGSYLEENAYTPSGWSGSFGGIVLNQFSFFGGVSKEQQLANGCGGLTNYPVGSDVPLSNMSVEQYHQLSESLSQVSWSSVLDFYQVVLDKTDLNKTLNDVKLALNAGDRLTFGVLLLDFDQGVVGAVGTHHGLFDSWVLTPEIAADINSQTEFAGHEMVITGYNDDGIAIDMAGRLHRGLLTLRNSWGSGIGDKGNFYMSYDYFKALAIEVQRIRVSEKIAVD